MATLSRKGLLVRVCRSVFQAMAELVLHEMQVRRGETRQPMILMVVEPDDIAGSQDLVRAVGKYASHSACWRYAARDKPKLAAFRVEEGSGAGEGGTPGTHGRDIPVGPALRGGNDPQPEVSSTLTGAYEAIRSRTVRTAKPKLRLAGDGPVAPAKPAPQRVEQTAPPAPPEEKAAAGHGFPEGFEDGPLEAEIVLNEPMPLDSKPMESRPAPVRDALGEPELPLGEEGAALDAGPLLSDEELAILLWDTWYPEQQEG
jgi:hypothetical protein